MVYIAGWLLSYWGAMLWYMGLRSKLVFLPALLYVTIVIVIRYSGTDTFGIYEQLLGQLLRGEQSLFLSGWEPAFVAVSEIFLHITQSEVWSVRAIGLLFMATLTLFYMRADKTEQKVFFLYLFPAFVYQLGMNAIRFGLAFAFILLGWQALRRGKFWAYVVLSLTATLFHYSAAVIALLLFLLEINLKRPAVVAGATVFLVGLLLLAVSRQEYLEAKLFLYADYASPSVWSGLSRSFAVTTILFGFIMPFDVRRMKVATLLLMLTLLGQGLALFSYAGLRILDILAASTPLVLLRWLDRNGLAPSKAFWLGLTLAGIASCFFLYRNFLSDYDGQLTGTLTPFLPYRTVFNYNP